MKFPTLVRIRQSLENVSEKGLLCVVNHLIKNNHTSTIVSGIFRQLYAEGESNSQDFFNEFLDLCQNVEQEETCTKQITPSNCCLDKLPDTLLNHVVSYLDIQDIFNGWNHINRRCVQVGGIKDNCNLESMKWSTKESNQLNKHSPKFSINPFLSKVEHLSVDIGDEMDMDNMVHLVTKKCIKTLCIRM